MGVDMLIKIKGLDHLDRRYRHYFPRGAWNALLYGDKSIFDLRREEFLSKEDLDFLYKLHHTSIYSIEEEFSPSTFNRILSKVINQFENGQVKMTLKIGDKRIEDMHIRAFKDDYKKLKEFLNFAISIKKNIIRDFG